MKFSLDDNSVGAGSSILLSPEVVAIRTKIIEVCDGKTFSDTIDFLKQLLEKEQDEQKRLGILAARVLVLRQRISDIQEQEYSSPLSKFEVPEMEINDGHNADIVEGEPDASDDTSWVRLRITENSIVKGVRFPKGVIVDVHNEEADALIEAGKAEIVEVSEEKNTSESDENTDSNSDHEDALKQEESEEKNDASEEEGAIKPEEQASASDEEAVEKKDYSDSPKDE